MVDLGFAMNPDAAVSSAVNLECAEVDTSSCSFEPPACPPPTTPPPSAPPLESVSVDEDCKSGVSSSAEVAKTMSSSGKLEVSVSNPEHHGEGRNKHTTYLVRVHGNPALSSESRRRYSDFQWLYGRFHTERPGAIIPIIPHISCAFNKQKKFSDEVVEERRLHLDAFMKRVVAESQELSDAPSLAAFLRMEDEMFISYKQDHRVSGMTSANPGVDGLDESAEADANVTGDGNGCGVLDEDDVVFDAAAWQGEESPLATNASGSFGFGGERKNRNGGSRGGMKKMLRTTWQKTATRLSVAAGDVELERTEDEETFLGIEFYIRDLEKELVALTRHASDMIRTETEDARGRDRLGAAFYSLGAIHRMVPTSGAGGSGGGGGDGGDENGVHENTAGNAEDGSVKENGVTHTTTATLSGGNEFVKMYTKLCDGLAAVSALENDRAAKDSQAFREPLQLLSRHVQSAKHAVQRRKGMQFRYTRKINNVKNRRHALDKIRSNLKNSGSSRRVTAAMSREEQVGLGEMEVRQAQEEALLARRDLNVVTRRLKREMEWFRVEVNDMIRAIVLQYAKIQMEYHRKLETSWENLLPFLEKKKQPQNKCQHDREKEEQNEEEIQGMRTVSPQSVVTKV